MDAGEQALELVNPDQPDIRLRAPVAWARQLATQTRLRVEGEQLSSHAIYYQRAASADPKSRLIELRLKPEAGTFIIGSPVRVALPMGEQHTMLLPRDALVLGTEGSVVYQVEQRGEALTVNRVPVTVLFGDSREVAVSGALKQGRQGGGARRRQPAGWGQGGAVSRLNLGQIPHKNGSRGEPFCCRRRGDYSTIITLQVLVLPTVSILSPWVSNTMSPLCSSPLALSTSSASRHTS